MLATSVVRRPMARRRRRSLVVCLVLVAVALGSIIAAETYVSPALSRLNSTVVTTGMPYAAEAEQWWAADADHLEELAAAWPASVPTLMSEIGMLWIEHERTLGDVALPSAKGYEIIPAEAAGRLHLLTVAMNSRVDALLGRWDRAGGHAKLTQFREYPIDFGAAAQPVLPEEIEAIIERLDLPSSVLAGYRVTLLPFALEGTAGLGAMGESVIGAAPGGVRTSPNRTAYTLLHELGHHVHFSYLDHAPNSQALWDEYMKLRGIDDWSESGAVGTVAWSHSPQETFAEDFRILFGPGEVLSIPHATEYGDPTTLPDRGESVRNFIIRLISK